MSIAKRQKPTTFVQDKSTRVGVARLDADRCFRIGSGIDAVARATANPRGVYGSLIAIHGIYRVISKMIQTIASTDIPISTTPAMLSQSCLGSMTAPSRRLCAEITADECSMSLRSSSIGDDGPTFPRYAGTASTAGNSKVVRQWHPEFEHSGMARLDADP